MTDLDALKEDLAYLRERGDLAAALTATTAELYRLIEEVERLRAVSTMHDKSVAAGEQRERAAVVAWLRERAMVAPNERSCLLQEALAYSIEIGAHRREGER